MRRQGGPISALIFGTLFLVIGGALAYFLGWPMVVEGRESRSWPATTGTITVSKVESHRNKENQVMYSPRVEYSYQVDGVQHQGNSVWIGGDWNTSSSGPARRTVASYPVGSQTQVFYDPLAPEVCVLEPGTTWLTYVPLGIGGCFFLIGGLVAASGAIKLLMGAFAIGAAATTAVARTGIAAASARDPALDRPRPPSSRPPSSRPPSSRPPSSRHSSSGHAPDEDDGIQIG